MNEPPFDLASYLDSDTFFDSDSDSEANSHFNYYFRDGKLSLGDNLKLMSELLESGDVYESSFKLIYVDPPYNSNESSVFTYRNKFDSDVWRQFMRVRLELCLRLVSEDGFIALSIDENELFNLGSLCDELMGKDNRVGLITVVHNPAGRGRSSFVSSTCEYLLLYAKDRSKAKISRFDISDSELAKYSKSDEGGRYRRDLLRRVGASRNSRRIDRPNSFYPIFVSSDLREFALDVGDGDEKGWYKVLPVDEEGYDWCWSLVRDSFLERVKEGRIMAELKDRGEGKDAVLKLYVKRYLSDHIGSPPKSCWFEKKHYAMVHGSLLLRKLLVFSTPLTHPLKYRMDDIIFSYPKSIHTMLDIVKMCTNKEGGDRVLDIFAGSGTTAHAVAVLNKLDDGNRKYLLLEHDVSNYNVITTRLNKVYWLMERGDDGLVGFSYTAGEGDDSQRDGVKSLHEFFKEDEEKKNGA